MDEVKLIEVIYCSKERRGGGVEWNPIRIIEQIYTKEGMLIMENDSCRKYTAMEMIELLRWSNQALTYDDCDKLLKGFIENRKL